jgi:hypothetical protein
MRLNLTPKVLKPDLSERGNGLRCTMITKALAIRLGPSLKLSSSFSATLVLVCCAYATSRSRFLQSLNNSFPKVGSCDVEQLPRVRDKTQRCLLSIAPTAARMGEVTSGSIGRFPLSKFQDG